MELRSSRPARWVLGIIVAVLVILSAGPAATGLAQGSPVPRATADPDDPTRQPRRSPSAVAGTEGVEVDPVGPLRVATTDRTSIVVVMIDDHPAIDRRVWLQLPAIRALFLEQGLELTRYHGNDPLCCPGRANFLTGLTTDHHGVWTNDAALLDPRTTIATELRAAGYFTIMAGKYLNHNLSSVDPQPPGWSRVAMSGNAFYDYTEHVNGTPVDHGAEASDYQPDVAFNRALQFLREAPAHRPVFAWITPYVTHGGKDPRIRRWPRTYAPVARRFATDIRCAGLGRWRTPAHAGDNADRPYHQRTWNRMRAGYNLVRACRALLVVDAGIARVVAELEAQGRLDDTLLILTADNGMGWGAHGWIAKNVSFATQMPFFARWPAGRGTEPAVDETFLSNLDVADTLCAIGGCTMGPYPDGRTETDGTSFLPVLTGSGTVTREALYTEHLEAPLWRSIRTTPDSELGLWHYTVYATGERELYDASGGQCWDWAEGDPGDPCELTNLAGRPELATTEAALQALLTRARMSGGSQPEFSGR